MESRLYPALAILTILGTGTHSWSMPIDCGDVGPDPEEPPTIIDCTTKDVQENNTLSLNTSTSYFVLNHDSASGVCKKKVKFDEPIPATTVIFLREYVMVTGESTRGWNQELPPGYQWVAPAPQPGALLSAPCVTYDGIGGLVDPWAITPEVDLSNDGRSMELDWTDPKGIGEPPSNINMRVVCITTAFRAKENIPAGTILEITQSPIPEPATMGLLALGGLVMLRRRKA